MKPWTVDAHCHWSDLRLFGQTDVLIPRMVQEGIRLFQLGGVDPEEWSRQTDLHLRFPAHIWRAFGLHPYFVAQAAELEEAWQTLLSLAPDIEGIGETGLDFRKDYLAKGKDVQLEYFRRHLELSEQLDKPVILHIVRAHEEALRELRQKPVRGMVHAFSASATVAKRYLDLGLWLSVGSRLLTPEAQELGHTVAQVPLESLLIESDCPDQAPPGQNTHDSTTVWLVAKRISELKSLPLERVVEQTRANLFTLLRKDLPA